jgi:hypothetical protein
MLKKLGLPIMALAALMAFAVPQKADARVRFGISFGAPVYTAPVPVAPYAYGYSYPDYPNYYSAPAPVDPYAYDYGYVAPAPYVAPVAPYYGFSLGFGGHHGYQHFEHERHEHFEHGHRR